jgi:pimeloyl-ACP methyl ester carboxylesterase
LELGQYGYGGDGPAARHFDVYALDLAEEPTALHGDFVQQQANFLAKSVSFLTEACGSSEVIIVAHSMGAFAARLALHQHKSLPLHNLVTLGTPHAFPILSFPSMVRVFRQLGDDDELALVSISGGLRDEMIPPEACYTTSDTSLSVLATDIMAPAHNGVASQFGMEHQAIFWCYNLLFPVRKIVAVLSDSTHEFPAKRIQRVEREFALDQYDYQRAVNTQRKRMKVRIDESVSMFNETNTG